MADALFWTMLRLSVFLLVNFTFMRCRGVSHSWTFLLPNICFRVGERSHVSCPGSSREEDAVARIYRTTKGTAPGSVHHQASGWAMERQFGSEGTRPSWGICIELRVVWMQGRHVSVSHVHRPSTIHHPPNGSRHNSDTTSSRIGSISSSKNLLPIVSLSVSLSSQSLSRRDALSTLTRSCPRRGEAQQLPSQSQLSSPNQTPAALDRIARQEPTGTCAHHLCHNMSRCVEAAT